MQIAEWDREWLDGALSVYNRIIASGLHHTIIHMRDSLSVKTGCPSEGLSGWS